MSDKRFQDLHPTLQSVVIESMREARHAEAAKAHRSSWANMHLMSPTMQMASTVDDLEGPLTAMSAGILNAQVKSDHGVLTAWDVAIEALEALRKPSE